MWVEYSFTSCCPSSTFYPDIFQVRREAEEAERKKREAEEAEQRAKQEVEKKEREALKKAFKKERKVRVT